MVESGIGSTSVLAMGGGAYRAPFTAIQWQELEQQAMIYKYLVAGLPIPPDLLMTIRHSLEALSARFFQYQYPSLGYSSSYYGKKFDPEPGRCRRTDGKKWRCSKEAHPDSKYCERHMHRGRNRSRKPVDSQSTAISKISSNSSDNGPLQNVSFQHMPLYSVGNTSEGLSFGSNVTKLQKEPTSYWMDNKEFRYIHGTTNSSTSFKQKPVTLSKQEQNQVHPFFSEWPTNKESWSNLDDDQVSNVNVLSSTQLSIAIPRGSSDFPSTSTYSSNDA